ncbi:MAG: class I tRNA ligase family protein [Spirochaetia bacterium]
MSNSKTNRPIFPKRAVVTGGMPYGNKTLHLGHIGGVFVHADTFARFLRDRIGNDNVIFVSGTDCYGSPIIASYEQLKDSGEFTGTIQEFVTQNHEKQKDILEKYSVSPNLYGASSLGKAAQFHEELGAHILKTLYNNGHLKKITSQQFYDPSLGVFLNGRQVIGRCPIPGCKSEKAYADECSLGHPYEPKDLINPKSTRSGEEPEMREVSNWYIDLPEFQEQLDQWAESLEDVPGYRPFIIAAIKEFLEPPTIYVKSDEAEKLEAVREQLPSHEIRDDKSKAIPVVFKSLEDREAAEPILSSADIRFRSGKTLTPFRLTGNVKWSVPAPDLEDLKDLTFWVWPESLWTPISFTQTFLESQGLPVESWKDWWCSKDAKVYQIIGEDNIYFYSLAEMSIFMGMQGPEPVSDPPEGELQLPHLIANNHILQFNAKASSSGKIKPIMAEDLLSYYTSDQLRAHFFSLGLGLRPIGFKPKPFNPDANPREGDPVMKEGNLLSNVFNRIVRSCFYTAQKYFDGILPHGEIDEDVRSEGEAIILEWEEYMYKHEFHKAMASLDVYIRNISKHWAHNMTKDIMEDNEAVRKVLVNVFHMVRVGTVLLHPVAPVGTEKVKDFLQVPDSFWDWKHIFEPISFFTDDPERHQLKTLEPRVDFFEKHESQFKKKNK